MIVVRFKVQCKPDKADQLQAAFTDAITPSRKVDGVINFDIARDLYDANSFIATEVFDDEAAMNRQESIPEVGTVMALLGEAQVGAPEVTIYEVASAEKRSM